MTSYLHARKKQGTAQATPNISLTVGGGDEEQQQQLDNSERSQQPSSQRQRLPSPDSGSDLHKKQQQQHHRYHSLRRHRAVVAVTRSLLPAHWSELQAAVGIVCLFLFLGLFVSYFLLHHQHRKVIFNVMHDPAGHAKAVFRGRAGFRHHFYSGSPRYVTVVLPSVVNPGGRSRRLDSIQDTWGPYARAIYVVHNVSEFPQAAHAIISANSTPEDPYAYPQLLMLPTSIGFDEGLPRLYYTIRSIHEKVNPDFAFFVNDHTFVLPSHLCKYLEHRSPTTDLYAGHALKNGDHDVFNSGAAGYLLSRETMKKLVAKWDEKEETCWLEKSTSSKWLQGNPGLVTTRCLESMGIKAIDTRAANKWHRFHAFPLTRVVAGAVDEWYRNKHEGLKELAGFDDSYATLLSGVDCCSMDTVSFHYVEWKESRALFAIQGELLANPHFSDYELKSMIIKEWPSKDRPKEIGAYSRSLPPETDQEGWKDLLAVLRKISTRRTQRDC